MITAIHLAGAGGPTLVVGNVESIAQELNGDERLTRFARARRDGAEGPPVFVNVDHVVFLEAVDA